MTLNLLNGGYAMNMTTKEWCEPPGSCRRANRAKIVEAIHRAKADVVALEETLGDTEELAYAVGFRYFSLRTHTISRFPLLNPPADDNTRVVLVVPTPGYAFVVSCAHALASPYGPYLLDGGGSSALQRVLDLERDFRTPPVVRIASAALAFTSKFFSSSLPPVVLMGDFNSPSPLDWTAAAVRARKLSVDQAVVWPLGQALADMGFRDAYRLVHPDPIQQPGFTWTPGGPEGAPPGHEVMDRIDWVLVSGTQQQSVPDTAVVVGPTDAADVRVEPWMSDHWGLAVHFPALGTASLPAIVSVRHRRVELQTSVDIYWWSGGASATSKCEVRMHKADHSVPLQVADEGSFVRINVTTTLREGAHVAELWCGKQLLSSAWFWVHAPGSPPSLSLTGGGSSVQSGEPFSVHVSNAPGEMLDYIGIFRCNATSSSECDTTERNPAVYVYTGAAIEGDILFAPPFFMEDNEPHWPLPPGSYRVRLLLDDDPDHQVGPDFLLTVLEPRQLAFVVVPTVILVLAFVMLTILVSFKTWQH